MKYRHRLIAAEISSFARYYERVVQTEVVDRDNGTLLAAIDAPSKEVVDQLPTMTDERTQRSVVLLNGTLNYHLDIEALLHAIKAKLSRTSRVAVVAYNPYFRALYRLRRGGIPKTFLTRTALENLARLTGFEVVRIRPAVYMPWFIPLLSSLINRVMPTLPIVRWLGLVNVIVLRPVIAEESRPSLSVIVPARNERGNIAGALERMPNLGADVEIVFVEGHSTDGTWDEIQRLAARHPNVRALRQTGRGKSDAVRLGFAEARGELLTILDADLTMPPEKLGSFYEAYVAGRADFINGSRLVYPMEGAAMRFLNHLGNIFFAKALSSVLDMRLGDSLCGTKLVARHDYERFVRWRASFGDFDPFGDFELLFPAAVLAIGSIDVPVYYRARTYGTTQIRRFRDGLELLRMVITGFFDIKMGRVP
jgi:Glycosyl transferase family 2